MPESARELGDAQQEWNRVTAAVEAFYHEHGHNPSHIYLPTDMTDKLTMYCVHVRVQMLVRNIRVIYKDRFLGCTPHYDAPEFKIE